MHRRTLFPLLALFLAHRGSGHSLLGPSERSAHDCSLDKDWQFQSYHIHMMFWGNSPLSTNTSLAVRDEFIASFGERVNGTAQIEDCPFAVAAPTPTQLRICSFGVQYGPAGPFTTAQWSFFIPNDRFRQTVTWTMQHRRNLDSFIHGNSGCSTRDHVDWPLIGGTKWEIDSSVLSG